MASHFLVQKLLESKNESLVRELGSPVDGKWESSADLIVASTALRAKQNPNVREYRSR